MIQLGNYQVSVDKALYLEIGIPQGLTLIRKHLVYTVKHNGIHKITKPGLLRALFGQRRAEHTMSKSFGAVDITKAGWQSTL